jgi:hypothetical protein
MLRLYKMGERWGWGREITHSGSLENMWL